MEVTRVITRLGHGLNKAVAMSGARSIAEFCDAAGVSYNWFCNHMRSDHEPMWMRYLRAVKRASGLTWDEILGW